MAARKVLLLLALTLVALAAAATAAAAQDTDDASEVVETFVGDKTVSPAPERGIPANGDLLAPRRCRIRYCGVWTRVGRCVSYYWWYGPINYKVGSRTPDGGRTVRACRPVRWCRGCYSCRTAKWLSCKRSYPIFTKGRVCPRSKPAKLVARAATTEWST